MVLREGVKRNICAGVFGLADLPKSTCEGTKQEEEVEVQALLQNSVVKVPGFLDLGHGDCVPVTDVYSIERLVAQNHEHLYNTSERSRRLAHGASYILRVGNVSAYYLHCATYALNLAFEIGIVISNSCAASKEGEVPCTALDHLYGHGTSQTTQTTD